MFKKIIWTLGSKLLSSVLNFLIVILTTQLLGATGRGEISLLLIDITVIAMVSGLLGGPALIYLTPRHELFKLLFPANVWALLSGVVCTLLLGAFKLISAGQELDVFVLALIMNLMSINNTLLTGKEKIRESNIVTMVQIVLMIGVLYVLLVPMHQLSLRSYLTAMYVSYGIGLLLSWIYLRRELTNFRLQGWLEVISKGLRYGFHAQSANMLQLLNFRLSYYLLNYYFNTALVGIYSTGVSVGEAVWIIGRSSASVQYARVANANDEAYSRQLTLRLSKVSFLLTLGILIPFLVVPEAVFTWVFGHEFGEVKTVMFWLAPGVASFGLTIIYGHYFSGIGKIYLNTLASAVGLVITLILGFSLIPTYGLLGAGICSSGSYLGSSVFLTWAFIRETKAGTKELLPSKADLAYFREQAALMLGRK